MIDDSIESENESNEDLNSDSTETSNINDVDTDSELTKPVTEKPIRDIKRNFAFNFHSSDGSHTPMERSISPDTDKHIEHI